jgi:hypothetical protein
MVRERVQGQAQNHDPSLRRAADPERPIARRQVAQADVNQYGGELLAERSPPAKCGSSTGNGLTSPAGISRPASSAKFVEPPDSEPSIEHAHEIEGKPSKVLPAGHAVPARPSAFSINPYRQNGLAKAVVRPCRRPSQRRRCDGNALIVVLAIGTG